MVAITSLSLDLESFSSINLTKAGVYRYVESPDFEILLFGYSVCRLREKVHRLYFWN